MVRGQSFEIDSYLSEHFMVVVRTIVSKEHDRVMGSMLDIDSIFSLSNSSVLFIENVERLSTSLL